MASLRSRLRFLLTTALVTYAATVAAQGIMAPDESIGPQGFGVTPLPHVSGVPVTPPVDALAAVSPQPMMLPEGNNFAVPNGAEFASLAPPAVPPAAPALADAAKAAAPAPTGDAAKVPDGVTWGDVKSKFSSWLSDSKANTYPNVTVNGVFQADAGFFDQDPQSILAHGDIQDGADFRRARLAAKAGITETVNAFFQMDFAFPGRPTFTDVWVEQTQLPLLGNFRVGQWKQPFSLEVVSSFRYTTFMERSLLFQAFTPFRHLGAGFYDHSENQNWTWAASGFRTGQDQFGDSISDNGGWGTAERLTHLFYYDEPAEGRYYLHGGLGHFFSTPPNHVFNFRTIPEIFIGENAPGAVGTSGQPIPGVLNGTPFFVATGPLALNNYNVLGAELLWVNGPLSLQSEAMATYANRINGDNLFFSGAYAQVGYFLTGEHRPYDRNAGAIDRVKPFTNFFRVGRGRDVCAGWGAWEVASRVSVIDLNDKDVRGGEMLDLTMGLNWYWNPFTKVVFNYIHAFNNNPTYGRNDTDIFAMRAQMDF